ncbi:MAG: Uma2 family endonuclease [Caldilineaceae bacterium]|nr:Uma2 family endonuclease [Caldilineaceae bacterium]
MDSAGIAERTWPPATAPANGRAPEPNPAADPTMTRAAREERAARRRAVPEAWRWGLEALYHYDAEYPYDPGHEYEPYWTTDPNYGIEEGIHHCRFDEDGVEVMADLRVWDIQRNAGYTVIDKLGNCVELETGVYYVAPDGVVRRVFPNLMVLPQLGMLGMAVGPERALRIDQGASPPLLVLEILSYGGAQRDLDKKLRLYERLGIQEYLVYDLGGKRRRGAPRELLLYRLEDGAYRRIDPEPQESASDPEVHWSDVFDAHVRMMPDLQEEYSELPETTGPPPRFQWRDTRQGRWRDRQTDTEVEREAERDRIVQERDQAAKERDRAVQERADMAVAMMRSLLSRELAAADLDRVEEAWYRNAPPTDTVNRILKVQQAPNEWQSLLLPDKNTGKRPNHKPPTRDTNSQ